VRWLHLVRQAREEKETRLPKQGPLPHGKAGKDKKGHDVDHKNGNPKDNSKDNLRAQSPSKNRSFPRDKNARKKSLLKK
jgi:hypothetical protein